MCLRGVCSQPSTPVAKWSKLALTNSDLRCFGLLVFMASVVWPVKVSQPVLTACSGTLSMKKLVTASPAVTSLHCNVTGATEDPAALGPQHTLPIAYEAQDQQRKVPPPTSMQPLPPQLVQQPSLQEFSMPPFQFLPSLVSLSKKRERKQTRWIACLNH